MVMKKTKFLLQLETSNPSRIDVETYKRKNYSRKSAT